MQHNFKPNLLICNEVKKNLYNYWGRTAIHSFYIVASVQTGRIEDQ